MTIALSKETDLDVDWNQFEKGYAWSKQRNRITIVQLNLTKCLNLWNVLNFQGASKMDLFVYNLILIPPSGSMFSIRNQYQITIETMLAILHFLKGYGARFWE